MEGMLTTKELTECLFKIMKGDTSPGCDGFTVNHLRVFWDDLKHLTTDALNCSFGNTLTSSLQKAIVKLLRKGTKDPTLPGNYRPISLLSIFYKLHYRASTKSIPTTQQHRKLYNKSHKPHQTHCKDKTSRTYSSHRLQKSF